MLGCVPTTPQDYPEWSGFGWRRERECGSPAAPAAGSISLLRADSRQNVRRILWPEWRRSATIGVLKSVEPTGFLGLRTRVCGNKLGGCESADHPKLPARPRMSFVFARLFGSGSAGLGIADVQFAFAVAMSTIGEQAGDNLALEQAVTA